ECAYNNHYNNCAMTCKGRITKTSRKKNSAKESSPETCLEAHDLLSYARQRSSVIFLLALASLTKSDFSILFKINDIHFYIFKYFLQSNKNFWQYKFDKMQDLFEITHTKVKRMLIDDEAKKISYLHHDYETPFYTLLGIDKEKHQSKESSKFI